MDADNPTPGPVVAGGQRLAAAVRAHFAVEAGLVYDASQSDPADWDALDTELNEVFRLTKQAVIDRVPIVYVLHEPSIWGHDTPLRAALATALLGGVRSVAVEGVRNEIVANAVSMSGDAEVERAASTVAWLLEGQLSGQLLTCGSAHLGRPAA